MIFAPQLFFFFFFCTAALYDMVAGGEAESIMTGNESDVGSRA